MRHGNDCPTAPLSHKLPDFRPILFSQIGRCCDKT